MLPNIVLFQGQDALNNSDLWETNGAGTGTFELAATGAGAQGLTPSDITVLGGQVLFEGLDLTGNSGLWTSDGTAAGTAELTSIVGASSAGLAPSDLTVFGGEALFSGINTSGQTGLWTTNGTANGTWELAGIIGAAAAGVAPTDLTVFNDEVLFTGTDSAGDLGLWVTNGTAGGTQELTGIALASSTGLDSTEMTVFNNEVLFNGVDANGLSGLWVTNGTVGGTHELVAGAGGASDPAGLNPTNITVYKGEFLFSGLDASGDMNLWVSDGTADGTQELTGVVGADSAGLAPSDLTVYNGNVLFRGLDQSGRPQLWITNGTVAGTQELTGIVRAATTGAGFDPSGFTVYDGMVLFSGVDLSGHTELWETDGTVAGTTEINPSSPTQSLGLFPANLTSIGGLTPFGGPEVTGGASINYVAEATPVALDPGLSISDPDSSTLTGATISIGAGFLAADALSAGSPQAGITSSYNAGTGVLTLSGSASLAAYQAALDSITFASSSAGTRTINWSISDSTQTSALARSSVSVPATNSNLGITLQNTSGQLALWQVSGATLSASGLLNPNPGPTWAEMGVGSFFSGDTSDILWQRTDGTVAVWEMQNNVLVSGNLVADPGPNWHIEGTGDFNADGNTDVLFQNVDGDVAIWEMNSAGQMNQSQSAEVANPGPAWHVEGAADFNGDGKSDILLQNNNGQVAIWNMNGDQMSSSTVVSANPGPSWHVEGTGDFYGDGQTDILWQNNDGPVAIWEMNGEQMNPSKSAVVANPGTAWHVVGTGDFNNDGKTDIVLQNNSGAVAVWDMNGSTIAQSGVIANPGPTWIVVGGHIG